MHLILHLLTIAERASPLRTWDSLWPYPPACLSSQAVQPHQKLFKQLDRPLIPYYLPTACSLYHHIPSVNPKPPMVHEPLEAIRFPLWHLSHRHRHPVIGHEPTGSTAKAQPLPFLCSALHKDRRQCRKALPVQLPLRAQASSNALSLSCTAQPPLPPPSAMLQLSATANLTMSHGSRRITLFHRPAALLVYPTHTEHIPSPCTRPRKQ